MGSGTTAVDGRAGRGGRAAPAAKAVSRRVNVLSGVAVALGMVLLLGGFVLGAVDYRPIVVPTDSMEPTVAAGDRLMVERIHGSQVRRGDIVVFNDSVWGDVPMLKRVVGVGGDDVACCDKQGRLTVNGEPVDEPYLKGKGPASPTGFDAKVPADRLFLLGDNRNTSADSRSHLTDDRGTVPRSAVNARVEATVWPLGRAGFVPHVRSFAGAGPVSRPGPLKWELLACAVGAVLVFGGAAAGPVAGRMGRRGAGRG
jgi:signal peptidase I